MFIVSYPPELKHVDVLRTCIESRKTLVELKCEHNGLKFNAQINCLTYLRLLNYRHLLICRPS